MTETKVEETFKNILLPRRWLLFVFLARSKPKRWRDTYICENGIPSKLLTKHSFPNDIEGLLAGLNFRKSKWLLFGTYHLPSKNDQCNFDCLGNALDVYSSYEKVILTGDFNSQESECVFDSFLYQHDLTNLLKECTC